MFFFEDTSFNFKLFVDENYTVPIALLTVTIFGDSFAFCGKIVKNLRDHKFLLRSMSKSRRALSVRINIKSQCIRSHLVLRSEYLCTVARCAFLDLSQLALENSNMYARANVCGCVHVCHFENSCFMLAKPINIFNVNHSL